MAKIYYNRIKLGLLTLAEVPAKYREQVQAMLDNDN